MNNLKTNDEGNKALELESLLDELEKQLIIITKLQGKTLLVSHFTKDEYNKMIAIINTYIDSLKDKIHTTLAN